MSMKSVARPDSAKVVPMATRAADISELAKLYVTSWPIVG